MAVLRLSSPGVGVLALAIPILFLHVDYQPKLTIPLAGEEATAALSDLAVLAVLVAGVLAGRRLGFAPLRDGVAVLVAAAALLVVVAAGSFLPVALGRDYPLLENLITAAKFAEYTLLAPAVALLVRTREDLRLLLGVLVVWAAAAAAVAVLQFLGIVPDPRGYRPGDRQQSFVGHHDLAALAGATLSVALARIALGPVAGLGPVLAGTALAAGTVGVVLSGALAGFLGVTAAAVAAALVAARFGVLTRRRATALALVVVVTGAGVVAMRAANIESFLRFLGIERPLEEETFGGESYVQRLALGYIGVRIFADHPWLGIGWQATAEEWSYAPYLDDARRRFPKVPERSLPSPQHPWGVQNGYLQAAAELGLPGALAFLAALLVPIAVAWRAATRPRAPADAALPLLWLLVVGGVWLGLGIVAGIPLVALQWLAAGLAMAAASRARAAAT